MSDFTFTANVGQLRRAIVWGGQATSAEPGLPQLCNVEMRVAPGPEHYPHYAHTGEHVTWADTGTVVTLASTDRYRLTWASFRVDEAGGAGVFMVPWNALAASMKVWPKGPHANLTVTVAGDVLTITSGGLFDTLNMSASIARPEMGNFPDIAKVLDGLSKKKPATDGPVALSPHFLGAACRAAIASGTARHAAMSLRGGVNGPAFLATAGEFGDDGQLRRSGLIMSVRLPSGGEA